MASKTKSMAPAVAVAMFALLGCGGPAALKKPKLNAPAAARQAVDEADSNSDSLLDQNELAAFPSLLQSLNSFDSDNDGALSADEIERELQILVDRGAALRTLRCVVTLGRRPLAGATVELVPEPFMGEETQPATGETDSSGVAILSVAPEFLPDDLPNFRGAHIGLFKVRITHPSQQIPAKYNQATTIGAYVSPTTKQLSFSLSTN